MGATVLSARELNRATLARQMLLERASSCELFAAATVQRVAGRQAQEPKPPFIGLWSRVEGFSAEALLGAVCARDVVRGTLMRSTLHLFSAADFVALRLALTPPASVALRVLGARAEGLDPDAVVSATGELLAGRPLPFDAIRAGLSERFPGVDERALGYAARTLVPLVMVPDADTRWGYPRICEFALAEEFLERPLAGRSGRHSSRGREGMHERRIDARCPSRRHLFITGDEEATDGWQQCSETSVVHARPERSPPAGAAP